MAYRLFITTVVTVAFAIGCSSNAEMDESIETDQAALRAPESSDGEQHCVVVLEPIKPGEKTSNVRHRECVTGDQAFGAEAQAASELLIRVYEHADYNGASTEFRGTEKCDNQGYGFEDLQWSGWNDRISSFKTFNNCGFVQAWWDKHYGGPSDTWHYGDNTWVSNVGAHMNDRISSMWVSRR